MDEPALLCRYVGMGRWDWIILGMCGAWLIAMFGGSTRLGTVELPWMQIAQISVMAVSAYVAFLAASVTAATYAAGRLDRLDGELDELTRAITDAYKARRAIDRAIEGCGTWEPGEKNRALTSALETLGAIPSHTTWPLEIEAAVLDSRFLIEDAAPWDSRANMGETAQALRAHGKAITQDIRKLSDFSHGLYAERQRTANPPWPFNAMIKVR